MKKGFALVEIIMCLCLIIGIGTISIAILKTKENNELDEITKKIIDAASIYINTEKDKNGNVFIYGLNHGSKAVQISVQHLEEKGYISEVMLNKLKDESGKDRDLYLLVSKSIKNNDAKECLSGMPEEYTVSWKDTNDTIYLCPYTEKNKSNTIEEFIKNKYTNGSCPNDDSVIESVQEYKTAVLCYNSLKQYYFSGNVIDNYLYYGNYLDGTKILWRIIYMQDGKIKLALSKDDIKGLIPVEGYTKDGASINFPYGQYQQYKTIINEEGEINYSISSLNFDIPNSYQSCEYKEDYNAITPISFNWNEYDKFEISGCGEVESYIYKYKYAPLKEWFDSTNLNNNLEIEEWYTDNLKQGKLSSKFGLLTKDEYYQAIDHKTRIHYLNSTGYNIKIPFINIDYNKHNKLFNEEITCDNQPFCSNEITFIGGYNVVFKDGNSCGNLVLRPAIIIDSKLEIISGDGSKNSPFELKNY